ncbi:MAG: hypothetical protein U9Q99_00610, partial [Nanoarchaeota archaeon]|nr:hypothetical protein [Nanoarchaeota archaeon]
MSDKYLKRLNLLEKGISKANKRSKRSKHRSSYKNGQYHLDSSKKEDYYLSLEVDKHISKFKKDGKDAWDLKGKEGYFSAIANEIMKRGIKKGNPYLALKSAKLYEVLGRGSSTSVKRRLLKSVEKAVENATEEGKKRIEDGVEKYPSVTIPSYEIKDFLKKNKSSGIENKLKSIFIASFILGIALSGFNLTGAIIGTATKEYTGFLGAILFISGIVGLV